MYNNIITNKLLLIVIITTNIDIDIINFIIAQCKVAGLQNQFSGGWKPPHFQNSFLENSIKQVPHDCLTRAHLLPLYHQYFLTFNTIITVNITIIFIIIHHWSFWASKSTRSRISLSTLTIQINKWINIPVSNDYPCIGSHWNDVKSLQITLKSVTKLFPTFAQKGFQAS